MKVLVVGKAPPIQGGVSIRTLSFVRSLRLRGHKVALISNADATPPNYSYCLIDDDREYLDQLLVGIEYSSVRSLDIATNIPPSPSFETRLYSIGISAAREADLIVGWYFQPYGVVASDLAQRFGKPLVLLHAGSDLGRLALRQEFADAYKDKFRHATILTTKDLTRDRLTAIFGDRQRIERIRRVALSRADWTPKETTGLPLMSRYGDTFRDWRLHPAISAAISELNKKEVDPSAIAIGMYGKIGESKGHWDLLAALESLPSGHQDFQVHIVGGGHLRAVARLIERISNSARLRSRMFFLPFIPPWRIGEFIRSCDVIPFLERGFDVDFHGPGVPREVLFNRRALLLSDEVLRKQPFQAVLEHGSNFFSGGDPREVNSLKRTLQEVLSLPRSALRDVGERGRVAAWDYPPLLLQDVDPVVATLEAMEILKPVEAVA